MLSPEQLESAKQKGTELGTAAFVKGLTPVEIVDELGRLVDQEGFIEFSAVLVHALATASRLGDDTLAIVDERVGWSVSDQVIGDLQKLVEQEG